MYLLTFTYKDFSAGRENIVYLIDPADVKLRVAEDVVDE